MSTRKTRQFSGIAPLLMAMNQDRQRDWLNDLAAVQAR